MHSAGFTVYIVKSHVNNFLDSRRTSKRFESQAVFENGFGKVRYGKGELGYNGADVEFTDTSLTCFKSR